LRKPFYFKKFFKNLFSSWKSLKLDKIHDGNVF
jgi:hypothetical protein